MTLFLNFRAQAVAGGVIDPYLMSGTSTADMTTVAWNDINRWIAGRNILFTVHGFNVNYADAVASFAALDRQFAFDQSHVMIGVLWPGDAWLPVVNYPFEGGDAMNTGNKLATFCNTHLTSALSLSFMSHSLGARVVLQAVEQLVVKVRLLCLTAGAINRDCLETEYAAAAQNASTIAVLASEKDWVLGLAFPIGDPIANVLHDDHRFFETALGYDGPPNSDVPVLGPFQIPDGYDYLHSSYLPTSDPRRWPLVADYVRRAFLGLPMPQPTPFPPPQP